MPKSWFRREGVSFPGNQRHQHRPSLWGPASIKNRAGSPCGVPTQHFCPAVLPPARCLGLAMAPTRTRSLLPLLLALATVLMSGPGDAQISIFPKEAFLQRGTSLQVNCSTSCNQTFTLGLETKLPKTELASGHNWKLFELTDIEEDSRPLCFENCGTIQASASAYVTVYSFPESVELDPLPSWQPVGKNLTLRCQVHGGVPRAQLTAVLLRGEVELSRQPVTELDLRRQGVALFQNISESRQLQTFELPVTLPKLDTPVILEVGTQHLVLCSLQGLFPASEAQVHLEVGGQRLNPTTTGSRDLVSATAPLEVTAELEGTQQLRCVVELAEQTLEAQETLSIYSFPAPTLTLSEPEVSEGGPVTVKCEAHGRSLVVMLTSAPAGPRSREIQLTLNASSRLPSPEIQFTLNASAEDHKRRFFCSAALKVAGQVLYKNLTMELHVLYGPRLDESDCLGNWTWPERSQQTLKCQAWGNPFPKLTCIRETDGALLPIGLVKTVKREMNGTYMCHAVNSQGNVTRAVFLTVLYHHQNNLVIIILVTLAAILVPMATAIYLYNRQRKIKIYKLQKAQEETAMKLKTQATPP
ncbi:intercellular adhesion molecule 1 isoform X2 [Nannospalax galili]|uniref:intercellular adhesion molecule 1 isoform X2 n=1 Tax=Nannospalax galili TaxID=1026970 RepID=UPI00111C3FC9|nr:intercellular adhesion molecule 1 isoform X2 [Nannospalax galili]